MNSFPWLELIVVAALGYIVYSVYSMEDDLCRAYEYEVDAITGDCFLLYQQENEASGECEVRIVQSVECIEVPGE